MFESIYKTDDLVFRTTVYSVRNDSKGYPHFLIYLNGQWIWKSAKYFVPKEGNK